MFIYLCLSSMSSYLSIVLVKCREIYLVFPRQFCDEKLIGYPIQLYILSIYLSCIIFSIYVSIYVSICLKSNLHYNNLCCKNRHHDLLFFCCALDMINIDRKLAEVFGRTKLYNKRIQKDIFFYFRNLLRFEVIFLVMRQ